MTTDTNPWAQAYLTDLDRAAATLPADRRAELREQITAHLADEMGDATDSKQARAVLARLGDPADLVAEAAADLSPASPAATRPSGAEIVSLLLMGIGGIVFPLIAPAIGVVMMRSTPRWTTSQVRVSWVILSVGLLAALGLPVGRQGRGGPVQLGQVGLRPGVGVGGHVVSSTLVSG